MKILALILILFFARFSYSQYPELSKYGRSITELIPLKWETLSTTKGDLNSDGIDDLVFVIKNTDTKNLQFNDGLGIDTVDLNPRILAIYFADSLGNFTKIIQSNEFILLRNSPTMDEPFDGIAIDTSGTLTIKFRFWFSAGSWYLSNHGYKFLFQNNRFELVEYTFSEMHRGTMEERDEYINFSDKIRKTVITTFNEETEEREFFTENESFEINELKSLKTMKKPFQWTFLGLKI